jgi:hypothetical protein
VNGDGEIESILIGNRNGGKMESALQNEEANGTEKWRCEVQSVMIWGTSNNGEEPGVHPRRVEYVKHANI